jgi:thiosulfate/3-mercaptopyruvate sulfurtransferase
MMRLKSFFVGAHGDAPASESTAVRPSETRHTTTRAHRRAPLRDDGPLHQSASAISRRTALRLAVALTATVFVLKGRHANAQPTFPGNGEPPLLIDPAWLQQRLSDPEAKVRVLDCSELRTYKDEHIPGAVHAWWQDTMDPNKPVYGGVLRPAGKLPDGAFDQSPRIQLLEDLGIDDQTYVVAYDDDRGRWAAHMVWFLRFLGHNQAAMLDGGLGAWRDAGFDTESGENSPPEVDQPTVAPQEGFYLETNAFERHIALPNTVWIDVRTDSELRDDVNATLPLGRIPGARSFPWDQALADNEGRLLSPDTLSAQLAALNLTSNDTVILYARFGVEASHTWLVFKLLGLPNVTIFDGGWAGWASDPSHPIEPL